MGGGKRFTITQITEAGKPDRDSPALTVFFITRYNQKVSDSR